MLSPTGDSSTLQQRPGSLSHRGYGPLPQRRTKHLIRSLLAYANHEVDIDTLMRDRDWVLQIGWETEKECNVETNTETLRKLTGLLPGEVLTNSQVRESIKYCLDFLEIFQDNRIARQGAVIWRFRLKLWHPHHAIEQNLQQLDLEWDRRRNAKYNQQTAVSMLQDWGESVDVNTFYGRVDELETLKQWLLVDRSNLIAIFGMGGIGKTAIATKLSQLVQTEFNFIFWRSLRNAPPFNVILSELIQFLSQQQETQLPGSIEGIVSSLLVYLKQNRCLIVLDNVESIFQRGTPAGSYRPSYEGYGTLFQSIGEAEHQSCLLLTSREKPREVARLDGALRDRSLLRD
jgi:hypothetical protein